MKLYEIAHSRTGDKGNISNISLIAYQSKDYALLEREVTALKVQKWLESVVKGTVTRYKLPQLGALNFVLTEALAGGVTASLRLDKHGKSLSSLLLEMEL